jgi:hypothetical protein
MKMIGIRAEMKERKLDSLQSPYSSSYTDAMPYHGCWISSRRMLLPVQMR